MKVETHFTPFLSVKCLNFEKSFLVVARTSEVLDFDYALIKFFVKYVTIKCFKFS